MTNPQLMLLVLAALAYLAGSIPFGLLVGKTRGIDVRKAGSGNIGATNVARLLGRRYFFVVFFLDLLKGALPVLAGYFVLRGRPLSHTNTALWLAVAVAAVAGHMCSIFLRFRGGKGVATSTGVVLGFFPHFTYPALVCLGIFAIVFFVWRYVSLGSMITALAFPLVYLAIWRGQASSLLLGVAVALAIVIIYKHRANISRLRAGTELKMGRRP